MIDEQPYIPDQHLFELLSISAQATEFLNSSPVGRTLYADALHQYRDAVKRFEKLSIADIMAKPEKVAEIRHQMDTATKFLLWADDIIRAGDRAEEELRKRDMSEQAID